MSLDSDYDNLRDIINDCAGYRVLDDDEVIRSSDETACGSMLMAGHDDWSRMNPDDFSMLFGLTVAQANDPLHNPEIDVTERMFRRKL